MALDTFDIYSDILDSNEKKFGLSDVEMSEGRLSTGLLTVDLLIGGGITCGGLFSISGKEASAKSTLLLHTLKTAIEKRIPIIQVRDAEQSMEPNYTASVVRKTMNQIFGVKDPKTGKWLKTPLARYYNSTALEELFDSLVNMLNKLPDKKYRADENQWYYVFKKDDKKSAEFRERLEKSGVKRDQKLFSQTGKYWYPTDNTSPFQAVIFIDSWPSLLPEKIDEEEEQGAAMAEIAREFAKHIKRIVGKFRAKRAIVFGVNQIRDRPGPSFGNPEYEPCGNALKFYSNCRNELSARSIPEPYKKFTEGKKNSIAIERDIFGKEQHYAYKFFRNSKNKTFTPFLEGWTRVWTRDEHGKGRGFDPAFDAFEFLNQLKIIKLEKKGVAFQFVPADYECPFKEGDILSWEEFKFLILNELGEYKNRELPKNLQKLAQVKLYSWCRKLLDSGKASTLMFIEPDDRKKVKATKQKKKKLKSKAK